MTLVVLVGAPRSGATLLSLALAQGEAWAVSSGTLARAAELAPGFTAAERVRPATRFAPRSRLPS